MTNTKHTLFKALLVIISILAIMIMGSMTMTVFAENTCADGVHNYEAKQTVAPKCYKEGYTVYVCTVCGDDYKDDFTAPVPHIYTNDCDTTCNVCEAVREITHTYDNACDTTCNVCKETREITHSYTVTGVAAPKCYKGGYTAYVCTVCGDTKKDDLTDPIPHIYTNDCDTTCNVCEAVRETTHVYDEEKCDDTCNVCGEKREAPHNYTLTATVAPKCNKAGYSVYTCSVCGDDYKGDEKEPTGHIYSASCSDRCSVCGEFRKTEHTYDNDCDERCNVCGGIRTVNHPYGKNGKCTVCGAKESAPNNSTELVTVIVILAVALIVIAGVAFILRNTLFNSKNKK